MGNKYSLTDFQCLKYTKFDWVLVAHTYNPSYMGVWKNRGSRAAQVNSLRNSPITKITRAKWTGGVAQVVDTLQARSSEFKLQSHTHTP
jgi:hypothetical protein